MNEERCDLEERNPGPIKDKVKIKLNNFTYVFCNPGKEKRTIRRYSRYLKRNFIKY